MRIGEYVAWIPSFAGSATTFFKAGWLAGLVVLVIVTTLTFVFKDIRNEGGFVQWATKLVGVFDAWDEFWTRHAKRRAKRKDEARRRSRRSDDQK